MKTEWLAANVTPVGSPDRANRDIFGGYFLAFFANSGRFCDREQLYENMAE